MLDTSQGGTNQVSRTFCEGPFLDSTQAQVETRIMGPLLVILVDWAWFTIAKWGLITNQIVRRSHKASQGKMQFLLSNNISL